LFWKWNFVVWKSTLTWVGSVDKYKLTWYIIRKLGSKQSSCHCKTLTSQQSRDCFRVQFFFHPPPFGIKGLPHQQLCHCVRPLYFCLFHMSVLSWVFFIFGYLCRAGPGHCSFCPVRLIALLHNSRNDMELRQVLFSSLTISHSSCRLLSLYSCTYSQASPAFWAAGDIPTESPKWKDSGSAWKGRLSSEFINIQMHSLKYLQLGSVIWLLYFMPQFLAFVTFIKFKT
jgi:hypothetical protein